MSKAKPSRYRTTNWSGCNDALRKRGSLLIWLDKEMAKHAPMKVALGAHRCSRMRRSSSACRSRCCSSFRSGRVSQRGATGSSMLANRMVASLLRLAELDWPVPDCSTLCRRQKTLKVQIPKDEDIGTVTADGACDTRRCHSAIIACAGTAFGLALEPVALVPSLPIRKNGRPWKEDCPAARARNETLRTTRQYGRAFRKRWTGYHTRSRAEAKMRGLKAFGERIAARDPDRQTAEIHIRVIRRLSRTVAHRARTDGASMGDRSPAHS